MPRAQRRLPSGRPSDLAGLSQSILRYANRGAARVPFLARISDALLAFLRCDAVELWARDSQSLSRWTFSLRPTRSSELTLLPNRAARQATDFEVLCRRNLSRGAKGYWTADSDGPYRSLALVPFPIDGRRAGLLAVKRIARGQMDELRARSYTPVAQTVGLAMAIRRAQWALRERVKELTCLYEIGRISQQPGLDLEEALRRMVELLPAAWQFPEIASARIVLDGRVFATSACRDSDFRQAASIEVKGHPRGSVEVVYSRKRAEFVEGAFLVEERHLIDTVAREVSLMVERREAQEYEARLQAQLRHADRLATIGQLAAGVAHELNEPLGRILGFAQLMQKDADLPQTSARDLERIVAASLHAREVIQKLLVFSRQKTPVRTALDLNRIVREGLSFLGTRCARSGIAIVSELAPSLPEIHADGAQLHQVLVNLVVNSIQAMPNGGEIRIRTRAAEGHVCLLVADTGGGMSKEVREKIFTPFFTTKDVNEGTGLGLAVVHGIVASHGGSIGVESAPGEGARVEIRLPVERRGED